MKDIAEGAIEHLNFAKRRVESSMQSISDCANDAWNKVMGDATVRSGIGTMRQTADEAWQNSVSALAKTGDAVALGAKNTAYVGGRAALGAAEIGENVYIGMRANAELATGDEDAAVHTAQSGVIDSAKEVWDRTMQVDGLSRKAGDFAEKVGGFAGETALGGMAVMASPIAAAVPTAVMSLNEMGKSLKESSADGEIAHEDVAKEVVAGGVAAGGVLIGRKLTKISEAKRYAPNSEVDVEGVKCFTDDSGKIYRKGENLIAKNKYEINGYVYQTDSKGRIASASGQLHLKAERERLPIRDSLRAIGHGNELKTDDRGHLIGDVFDGGNDMGNIVAMDGKVNRSAYKKLENKWRKELESGSAVEVKIKPIYEGDSARPSQFAIVDVIDEKKTSAFLKNL